MKKPKQDFSDLITTFPKIFGPHGTRRNELVRLAESVGLDDDRIASDYGPFNQKD